MLKKGLLREKKKWGARTKNLMSFRQGGKEKGN